MDGRVGMTPHRSARHTAIATARVRARSAVVGAGLAALALLAGSTLDARADSGVVGKLAQASAVVEQLTKTIDAGGDFGDVPNAAELPFLGADPTQGVDGLFGGLDGLDQFSDLPGPDAPVSAVTTKVQQVDDALGAGEQLSAPILDCAGSCDGKKVSDITSLRVRLTIGSGPDPKTGEKQFEDLELDSLSNFLPKDAGELKVRLRWQINVDLVADVSGLKIEGAADKPELSLTATVSLEGGPITVDLGALRVRATPEIAPTFTGVLNVDFEGTNIANPKFSFGPDSGFRVRWGLATTNDSPLKGLSADLDINWPLAGQGVDPSGLKVELADLTLDTSRLIGDDLSDATEAVRSITRPIRKATAPVLEPLPGLSDLSNFLGQGDTSVLSLAEFFGFNKDFRKGLTTLAQIDDGLALLGGGTVNLGKFSLDGTKALRDDAMPDLAQLAKVLEQCGPCKEGLDKLLAETNPAGGGSFEFDFPVLKDPASLAGLLLGRDVDIFTFDTGNIGALENVMVPLVNVFIFAVKIEGDVEARTHLKGGFDTAGIRAALLGGEGVDSLLHGLYLEDPGSDAVARLRSTIGLSATGAVIAKIKGTPKVDVKLEVPPDDPGPKLRPFKLGGDIGCALLKAPDAAADFKLELEASLFEDVPLVPTIRHTIADHTFLSKTDLCPPPGSAPQVDVANVVNGILKIRPGSARGVAPGEEDQIKVFARHDADGNPTKYVVSANGNTSEEFDAEPIIAVEYESPGGDDRPVRLRAVASDGRPFEEPVLLKTAGGDDDISLDLKADIATTIALGAGNDTYVGGAGQDKVSGGPGDDLINGGKGVDLLSGDDDKDTISGDEQADQLDGGPGDDLVGDISVDKNVLIGGVGADTLISGRGDDGLIGDTEGVALGATEAGDPSGGDDVVITGGGADKVIGGNGADLVMPTGTPDRAPVDGDTAGVLVRGNGGNDQLYTGGGGDEVHGGPGNDIIDARDGANLVHGGSRADDISSGGGEDRVFGDDGADACVAPDPESGQPPETATEGGADTIAAGGGNDRIAGELGDDIVTAGGGDDLACGHAGADRLDGEDGADVLWGGTGDDPRLSGGNDADRIYGGVGADALLGDGGDDLLLGQDGDDDERGGDGFDRMFGNLGADTMRGDDGPDFMLGDQGTIDRGTGTDPGGAPRATVLLQDPGVGGADTMDGGAGDDHLYGGAQNDTVSGGQAGDHVEGNGGEDRLYGASPTAGDGTVQPSDDEDARLDGQDDIIGGSSAVNPLAVDDDEGETVMRGDGAQDVMAGDNASITRRSAGASWLVDNITGGIARDVQLLDTEKRGAALLPVGGADLIAGNAGNDRLYGESDSDTLRGNDGEDYAEGNQAPDWIEGNGSQDDLIGGSSVAGQPDDGDYLHGGAAADVMTGDNAVVTRDPAKPGGPYNHETDRLEIPVKRWVKLLDLTAAQADLAGTDQMSGGAGADVMFGQDEPDLQSGGSEDDYMEGNGDADRQWGDRLLSQVGAPGVLEALAASASSEPELSGPQGAEGQDDQIGGSSIKAMRDTGDVQYGDGGADFQLGDNGELRRRFNTARTQYLTYEDANATTLQRQATRFDVGGAATAWGIDEQRGGAGDDYQWGQDGGDTQYGDADNDDQHGELGADRMFGGDGEDAMIGDRGVITDDRLRTDDPDDIRQFTYDTKGPAFVSYTAFRPGSLHRFVDLKSDGDGDVDGDGNAVEKPGQTAGGGDYMRGGDGRDSIHGAFGDDVANGDSHGDAVYGDDGADALWGGRGNPDSANPDSRGTDDAFVDYLFGGHGGDPRINQGVVTGGADILDYRPRPGQDPAAWFEATNTDAAHPGVADNQHNHGVDMIYGGWDRDVLQANLGSNGPDRGDRLFDWAGNYNLFTHCHASYGGDNDIRSHSPKIQELMQRMAFGTGAGTSLADVQSASSSAYRELALVYNQDVKHNSGGAYPTTPGHFERQACAE